MEMNDRILGVLQDKDAMGIAHGAASRFKKTLSKDEIRTCILSGIWTTLTQWEGEREHGCSLTTYLYRAVLHECIRYQDRVVNGHKDPSSTISLSDEMPIIFQTQETVEMLDEIEHSYDPEIMFDRFFRGMTIKEIALKHGRCRHNISGKIRKNLDFLRQRLENGV